MFIMVNGSGGGVIEHPKGTEFIKNSDDTYQVNITWYDTSSEKPTDSSVDWYQSEDDPNTYFIAYSYDKMILKYVEGSWQILSYSKA